MDDASCDTEMEPWDGPTETIATEASAHESSRSLESQSDSEAAGAWSFRAFVRGAEWDPSLFTRVLNGCTSSALKTTLDMTTIFSNACSDRSSVVPDGCVAVDGYLKIKGSREVRRGTLRRRLQHPDLSSIEWTACMVGRQGRYTDHDFIQNFSSRNRPGPGRRPAAVYGCGQPPPARRLPWTQRHSPQPGRLGRP